MTKISGETLRKAREEKKQTLDDVSKAIYIKVRYLQALEAGNFDVFHSLAQGRGFLRAYATYLGVNADELLDEMAQSAKANLVINDAATLDMVEPEQALPAAGNEETDLPFVRVGEQLRERRMMLGISLEDVERQTHIKEHYLAALESGDIDKLPSPVQGRGMLGNYADFLGMNADALLLGFAEGIQARFARRQQAIEAEKQEKHKRRKTQSPKKRLITRDMVIMGGLVAFLFLVIVFGWLRIAAIQRQNEGSKPTVPSIADLLIPSETPTVSSTATATSVPGSGNAGGQENIPGGDNVAATQQFIVPAESDGVIQVQIVIRQRAWMRVSQDGEVAFEGRVVPGSAYAFAGDERVEILTGNAAALDVTYGQQKLGLLGFFGEAVDIVITTEGVQTPTPTITPSPTGKPRPTSAPTATATPKG